MEFHDRALRGTNECFADLRCRGLIEREPIVLSFGNQSVVRSVYLNRKRDVRGSILDEVKLDRAADNLSPVALRPPEDPSKRDPKGCGRRASAWNADGDAIIEFCGHGSNSTKGGRHPEPVTAVG